MSFILFVSKLILSNKTTSYFDKGRSRKNNLLILSNKTIFFRFIQFYLQSIVLIKLFYIAPLVHTVQILLFNFPISIGFVLKFFWNS